MRHKIYGLTVALLIIGGITAPLADAAACDPNFLTLGVQQPAKLATGRTSFSFDVAVGDATETPSVTATATTSDGTPVATTTIQTPLANTYLGVISGLPKTGNVSITIAWHQEQSASYAAPTCDGSKSFDVTRFPGNFGLGHWAEVSAPKYSAAPKILTYAYPDCELLAVAKATISVSALGVLGKASRQVTVPDQCSVVDKQSGLKKHVYKVGGGKLFVGAGVLRLTAPTLAREGDETYSITVTVGRHKENSTASISFYPATTVWQGTDSFVNVCVNESLEIFSSGGKLYCTDPPLRFFAVK
jgi:hypothetical protein